MADVDDWVVPKDDWVVPGATTPSAAPPGAQGSLYDPNNPVLSDDPRYWRPPGPPQPPWWRGGYGPFSSKAPTEERGTFVPLAAEAGQRPELSLPGMLVNPYQGAKTVLETPQGDERTYAREVGPSGLAGASVAQPFPANRVPTIPKPMLSVRPSTAAAARISRAAIEDRQPRQSTVVNPITAEELASDASRMIRRGTRAGQDVRMMDVAGEATQGETRRAADLSSRAQSNMAPFTEERWKLQATRIAEWLRNRMGNPKEAHLELDAIKELSKDPKAAAYKTAFTAGSDITPSIGLAGLMQAEDMQAFARTALQRYERSRLAGNTIDDTPIQPFIVPRGGRSYVFNPNHLPLEYWDRIKRVMDDAVGSAMKAGRNTEAMDLSGIRKQILDELDTIVPQYRMARGVAAEAFAAGDAVEAGQKIALDTKISRSQIDKVRNKTPAAEWGRVQIGFFTEYMRNIERVGDRQNILLRLAQNNIERRKIEAVLGRDVADDLQAVLFVEEAMQKSYRALHGGTMTPRRLARMHTPPHTVSAVAAGATYFWTQSWKMTLTTALLFAARRADEAWQRAVAERVADMLISKDPRVYMRGIYEAKPFLPNLRAWYLTTGPKFITSNPEIMELPQDRDELQTNRKYRNKRGQVMRFDGERFQGE